MKGKDLFQYIFAGFILLLYFGVITLLFLIPIPGQNKDVLMVIAGALTGLVVGIGAYYWGSSAGSASKDETINSMLK